MLDDTEVREQPKRIPVIPNNAELLTKKSVTKKNASKKARKGKKAKTKGAATKRSQAAKQSLQAKYPRYTVDKALRIPRAILDQNAGKECTDSEAAGFLGIKLAGPLQVEINAAIKYGFLQRPSPGKLQLSDLARQEGTSSARAKGHS
jgi:hypothetical protein